MRAHRYARLPIAALAALVLLFVADAGAAWAQHRTFRASGINRTQQAHSDGSHRTGKSSQRRGGRYRTGGRGHRRDGGQRNSDKGTRRDGGQRSSDKDHRRDGGQRTSDRGHRRDRGHRTRDNEHRRDAGQRSRGRLGPRNITAIPRTAPAHRRLSKGGTLSNTSRPTTLRPRNVRRPGPSGAPPAGERRFVVDEVVIEIANSVSPQRVDALQRRFRLTRIEQHVFQLTGTTLFRWRIPDRRSVATVVRALERDATVASVQPNYLFRLQQTEATSEGDAAQYELAKLRLPQAHKLAKGDNVRVALIDSAVDLRNAELADSIAATFDTLASAPTPHKHGTAIAGLIAGHGRLMGAAPAAKLLAVRAFDPDAAGAQGTTFNILKGLDWAAANRARIVNMSFAGPADPMLHRSLQVAHERGIVLIAAAGNAGAKSPPLYPAADPNVIAVSATDADDRLFKASNRGRHIALAAPGDRILVAIPDGYEVASGTSYSAAEVSGIAALLLERDPALTPGKLRQLLQATAKDLGPRGQDSEFGAGLVDAYAALSAEPAPVAGAAPTVVPVSAGAR